MKKIADTHLHFEHLESTKIKEFLDIVAGTGVTDASILAICTMLDFDIANNILALYWKENYKKIKLRVFGSFHEIDLYKDIPYEKQAEKLLSLGCDGIKFIQMKPDVRKLIGKGVNHTDYDKAFSLLEERQIPVLIHSGDPETNWDASKVGEYEKKKGWFYGDGTFLSREEHYEEVFGMLDKHPNLPVTLAHFFFLSNFPDEVERIFDKYPNVRFDLTPGWEMYLGFSKDIDRWQGIFEKHSTRILFGTDSNSKKGFNEAIHNLVYEALTHDKTEFNMPCYGGHIIKGLDLSERALKNICYNNYIDFVGSETRPVDMKALYETAERVLCDIRGMEEHKKSAEWLAELIKNA
jgi:predicted TIM-barrel fold metal-dependent hydrolase